VNRSGALWAVLVLFAGQAARAASCACSPCPLEAGGTCRPEPKPSCCGEPEPKQEETCSCAHFSSPEGVPAEIDAAASTPTIEAAIPVVVVFEVVEEVVSITPRGPGPPTCAVPVYLRDLTLRL
jgi:hypothetical protein